MNDKVEYQIIGYLEGIVLTGMCHPQTPISDINISLTFEFFVTEKTRKKYLKA